ncbi:MAG: hypothetical protein Kow0069_15340 [Promethearchaeota archaeon]
MTVRTCDRELGQLYDDVESGLNVGYWFDPGDGRTFQRFNDHPLNYRDAMRHPVHSWVEYKEGFSPGLVGRVLAEVGATTETVVLDPFCGGGTTPVTCFYRGVPSVGVEANPFSHFLAKVKTRRYRPDDLRDARKLLPEVVNGPPAGPPSTEFSMIDRLFPSKVLGALLGVRERVDNLGEEGKKVRDLFFLAWLALLEPLSNYRKAGNGLKRRVPRQLRRLEKLEARDVNAAFARKVGEILSDLESYCIPRGRRFPDVPEPAVLCDTCLNLERILPPESVGATVFSPPYLNCFDYAEIYKVELWLGGFVNSYAELGNLREKSMISHVNNKRASSPPRSRAVGTLVDLLVEHFDGERLWNQKIPDVVRGYFGDFEALVSRLADVHLDGSLLAVVVSNSSYGGVVVPTDALVARIAESYGFSVVGIEAVRPIVTSSQQFSVLRDRGLTRFMRESVVWARK